MGIRLPLMDMVVLLVTFWAANIVIGGLLLIAFMLLTGMAMR